MALIASCNDKKLEERVAELEHETWRLNSQIERLKTESATPPPVVPDGDQAPVTQESFIRDMQGLNRSIGDHESKIARVEALLGDRESPPTARGMVVWPDDEDVRPHPT